MDWQQLQLVLLLKQQPVMGLELLVVATFRIAANVKTSSAIVLAFIIIIAASSDITSIAVALLFSHQGQENQFDYTDAGFPR